MVTHHLASVLVCLSCPLPIPLFFVFPLPSIRFSLICLHFKLVLAVQLVIPMDAQGTQLFFYYLSLYQPLFHSCEPGSGLQTYYNQFENKNITQCQPCYFGQYNDVANSLCKGKKRKETIISNFIITIVIDCDSTCYGCEKSTTNCTTCSYGSVRIDATIPGPCTKCASNEFYSDLSYYYPGAQPQCSKMPSIKISFFVLITY